MIGVKLFALSAVFALVTALTTTGASAAELKAFYGKFAGEAVIEFDSRNKGVGSKRKSQVEIKAGPEKSFELSWTTSWKPDANPARVRTARFIFAPTPQPNTYFATTTGNPLLGQALIWARVAGSTLTVYIVGMLDGGVMVSSVYRRTVNGSAMDLEFVRIEDGKRRRAVKGTLKRVAG